MPLNWRRALLTVSVLAVSLIPAIALYDYFSDGWFSFFVFKVPAGHDIDKNFIKGFWSDDMLKHVAILCAISVAMLAVWLIKDRDKALRYASLVAGFMAAAYIARLHRYGWSNVLMPAHAVLALMAGLALAHYQHRQNSAAVTVLALLLLVQMGSACIRSDAFNS